MTSIIQAPYSNTTGNLPDDRSGEPSPSDWQGQLSVSIVDDKFYVYQADGNPKLVAHLITEFSASKQYRTDDLLLRNGSSIYKANTDHLGPWAESDFDLISAAKSISVLREPAQESESKITLAASADPANASLVVQQNVGQTGNLQDWRNSDAVNRSWVNRRGLPGGALEQHVVEVSQVAHSFTSVGQAASFDGTNWTLALADNQATIGYALVREIIDADNIVLQFGGRIPNLSTSSFAGGSITSGAEYYVSSTVPGQLTTVAPLPPSLANKILLATGSTEGQVLQFPVDDGSGSSLSGNDTLAVSQPGHGFTAVNNSGSPIYFDGSLWVLAQANAEATLATAVIRDVPDPDNLLIQQSGSIPFVAPVVNGSVPLVAGEYYFVSAATAGQITSTEPTNPGEWSNPVFLALSTSTALILPFRASTEGLASSRREQAWTNAAGQTIFVWDHEPDSLDVYLNGVKLTPDTDYTADGLNIVLSQPVPSNNDVLYTVTHPVFDLVQAVVTSDNAQQLREYADDSAAAAGGVPIGGMYHTSGSVKVRVA